MIGAILGDIIGSRFEFNNIKTKEFELFTPSCSPTDDSVLTCAVAEALMRCEGDYTELSECTVETMRAVGRKYPYCGFGGMFIRWLFADDPKPYNSFGNGSAMRISPVGFIARDVEEAKVLARKVTVVTHNHPEGMKGAEAAAVAIVMARQGCSKDEIRAVMERDYYKSVHSVDEYREIIRGHGDETCQVSMPEALQCFYEGEDYEDVIRNCVSIGGDSDTLGAIAGGIAEAYFGVPEEMGVQLKNYLDPYLLGIVERFEKMKK